MAYDDGGGGGGGSQIPQWLIYIGILVLLNIILIPLFGIFVY